MELSKQELAIQAEKEIRRLVTSQIEQGIRQAQDKLSANGIHVLFELDNFRLDIKLKQCTNCSSCLENLIWGTFCDQICRREYDERIQK